MKTGNLQRALRKSKKFYDQTWCGYFTPSEIIALVEDGAKPDLGSQYQIPYTRECIKKGDCSRSWFYFYLGKTKPDKPNQHGDKYGKVIRRTTAHN